MLECAAAPWLLAISTAADGRSISLLWSIPFVALLLTIALAPLINRHWWEKWYPAVAVALGLVPSCYYWLAAPSAAAWLKSMEEYVSFIILLAALFVVSGGILIHVSRKATPAANTAVLLTGAIIANIFGTTGASMLLIRPYLRMNRGHIRAYHVVFFIFIVSNCGGALTPIGDPPLYLGYLNGVPFWWVLKHCYQPWLLAVGLLLTLFFLLDTMHHRRAARHEPTGVGRAVTIRGAHNLLFICAVLLAVFQPGLFETLHALHAHGLSAARLWHAAISREVLMTAAAAAAWLLTPREIYRTNEFTWAPIREVAVLFVGIFAAMTPALQWLDANARRLPLTTPGRYYFATGTLSAFLDNAPTYLTFLESELASLDRAKIEQAKAALKLMSERRTLDVGEQPDPEVRAAIAALTHYHPDHVRDGTLTDRQVQLAFLLDDPRRSLYLVAISLGAVFFGACTYIGNGPNFMVKSIADSAGVAMPTFLGYLAKYTLPILVPICLLVWRVFLYSG